MGIGSGGSRVDTIQVKKVFKIIRTHIMQKQERQLCTFKFNSIFTIKPLKFIVKVVEDTHISLYLIQNVHIWEYYFFYA